MPGKSNKLHNHGQSADVPSGARNRLPGDQEVPRVQRRDARSYPRRLSQYSTPSFHGVDMDTDGFGGGGRGGRGGEGGRVIPLGCRRTLACHESPKPIGESRG